MTTVLLVWEEIPEAIKFYRLEGADAEIAVKAHGFILNSSEGEREDAAEQLNELLEGKEPLDTDNPLSVEGIDLVVTSGFMM